MASGSQSSVRWTDEEVRLLITVLLEQKAVGNWAGTGPNSAGLKYISSSLQNRFNVSRTSKQVKNKYEAMKAEFTCWNKLKSSETGLGWDVHTGTIQASDEWWDRKIREDPLAKKFKNRAPILEDLQTELFGNSIATGSSHWTPASNRFISDQRRDQRLDLNDAYSAEVDYPNWGNNVGSPVNEEDSSFNHQRNESQTRRGAQPTSRLSGEKRKQMEGSSGSHFEEIKELLGARSVTVNYNTQADTEWDTVFQKLNVLFGDDIDNPLYLGTIQVLQDDVNKRKVFIRYPERSLMAWINQNVRS